MAIFTTLRGEIHNSIRIIAILSMSYITIRIVKTQTSVAKIPRVPAENQITTLSVVKIAMKFSPCTLIRLMHFSRLYPTSLAFISL